MDREDLSYAGFWVRLWASVIDSVLVLMIVVPLLRAIYGDSYVEVYDWSGHPGGAFGHLISTGFEGPGDFLVQVVFPAVAILAFWIFRSATPGKMVIHAQIVDARTGEKPSTAQLIGRYFAYYLSALPLFLGFLWIAFDSRKQGWHDKLAGTVVVRPREVVRFETPPGG